MNADYPIIPHPYPINDPEGDDGISVQNQPTGAQDAYAKGDKVHYPDANSPVYESTVDNNVWKPGVYSWEQVA